MTTEGPHSLTFAFVDLAGYTALTEQHGDADAADCAARFYELTRSSLQGDTRIVKRIGDAVMLVSTDAGSCVATVVRLFRAADAEPRFPALRAGLHAGPALEREADYFGTPVNIASRIGAHARSGEVLCGDSVAAAIRGASDLRVTLLGTVRLKNLSHPVEIWSVLPTEVAASTELVDPVCRMRVGTPKVQIEHGGRLYAFCSDACADRFRAAPESFVAEVTPV